ncbi:MAG: TetR/AcrR family transcriptional regulator [Candidatus Hydrogenedentes bacterium]|nr:TetR/AcrR family transcriptional regulator [Candidatus Hydrogenedentota bacterium]
MRQGPHNVPGDARQANETQQRLLDSALTLFAEQGYDGTSVREIIERAKVTRPVLYYYFENKEHLFRQLLEAWFSELIAGMDKALETAAGYRARLQALMDNAFEHANRSPEVLQLVFQAFFSPRQQGPALDKDRLWRLRFDRILGVVREGFESGELTGRKPETVAMAFCGMMDAYLMAKCQKPEMHLSNDLATALVKLFLGGAVSKVDIHAAGVLPLAME